MRPRAAGRNTPNQPSTVIEMREFIGTVLSHKEYHVDSFPVNPADPVSFPWLSQAAQNWDQWKPVFVSYEYVPTSGTYTTEGSALGTVALYIDYNARGIAPPDKQAFLNNYGVSVGTPASKIAMMCDVRRKNRQMEWYNTHRQGAEGDPRLNDLGTLHIMTHGQPAAASTAQQPVGDLYVRYKFVLTKAQVPPYFAAPDAVIYQQNGSDALTAMSMAAGGWTHAANTGDRLDEKDISLGVDPSGAVDTNHLVIRGLPVGTVFEVSLVARMTTPGATPSATNFEPETTVAAHPANCAVFPWYPNGEIVADRYDDTVFTVGNVSGSTRYTSNAAFIQSAMGPAYIKVNNVTAVPGASREIQIRILQSYADQP